MAAGWDPMLSDYQDPEFNSYIQGVGRDLTHGNSRNTKLYVDNFPVELGQDGFYNLFSEFGHVLDAKLKPSNRENGQLTYGFITMDSAVAAEHAISHWNRKKMKSGAQLIVKPAMSDDQKRKKEERKQMDAQFMASLGRSNFNSDAMPLVPPYARQSDYLYDNRVLAARAKELLERTGHSHDLDFYLSRGRGYTSERDNYGYRDTDMPYSFGRGKGLSSKDSSYLRGLSHGYEGALLNGIGRGRSKGSETLDERPRPGPPLGRKMNASLGLGRGSTSQQSQLNTQRPKFENPHICVNCGTEDSAYRCQACKAYYCSHECQRKDWTRHKEICLDISIHNFNMKFNPHNDIDFHNPMLSGGNKLSQNHHDHHDDRSSTHSDNREFKKSNNLNFNRENEGRVPKNDRNVKENNRGYESEACSGGGSSFRNQNKFKGFNKQETKNRSDNHQMESKGRYQEQNGGVRNKAEDNICNRERKEDRLSHNFSANKGGGYKGKDRENDKAKQESKVFQNSELKSDKNLRPQKSQADKRDIDKKRSPLKFNKSDQQGQYKEESKNKPAPGRYVGPKVEKMNVPQIDEKHAKNRSEGSRGNKAKTNIIDNAGSGDAACDLLGQTMEVGAANKCYLTHYESPSKFWIMLKDDVNDFFNCSEKFKQILLEIPKGEVKRVKAGDLYCMIDGGFWARVKIVTVNQDDSLTVFFPDVGKQEVVSVSQLFHLHDTMRLLHAQAMCCCIGNAKPKGKMWNEKAKSVVEKWLGEPYVKEMSFKVVEKRGNTHALEMINGDGVNLAGVLISQGLAETSSPCANLPRLSNKTCEEAGPESSSGTRFMAKDITRQMDCLEVTDVVPINITEAVSLTNLMGRIINPSALEALHQIESIVNKMDPNKGPVYRPVEGELVLAKFSVDNKWYRAEVSRIKGEDLHVVFLDYGNRELVKAKDIRKVADKRLTQFPATAACLQLWNVDKVDEEKAMDHYAELLKDFLTDDGKWSVVIKDKTSSSIFVDFVSWAQEETLSELLKKKLLNQSSSPASKEGSPKKNVLRTSLKPHESLPSGVETPVVVISIDDCSSFYVTLSKNVKKLRTFMLEINNDVKSLSKCDGPAVGDLVLALFDDDEIWYRAQIKSVMKNKNKFQVFYLDYGNCWEVSAESMRQLPKQAFSQPAFAIHCGLDIKSVKLLPEADTTFKCVEGKSVPISVLRKEEGSDKYIVKMMGDDGSDLLQVMALDEETESSTLQEMPPNSPASTDSSQKSEAVINPASVPISDEPFTSIVCHMQSLCEFYLFVNPSEALEAELQIVASEQQQVKSAHVGSHCIAKFSDNGVWYRAKVTSSLEDSATCTLKFIDYGNSQETLKEDLRELPSFAKSPPTMAIPCCFKEFEQYLDDCRSQDLKRIEENEEFGKMKSDVSNFPVHVTVHGLRSGVYIVTLMDEDGNNVLDRFKVHATSPALAKPSCKQPDIPTTSQPAASLDDIKVERMKGSKFEVVCTNMESLTEFFCQRKDKCIDKAIQVSQILMRDLASISPVKCKPVKGNVYGCLFEGTWYRCAVEEVKGDKVRIQYIDWGNKEDRDVSDLRPLQPEHLAFPISLMKCRLHGMEMAHGNEITQDIVQQYIKELSDKILVETNSMWVEITAEDGDFYQVSVTVVSKDQEVNINEDLIKIGIAKPQEQDEDEEEEEDEEEVERKMRELQKQMEQLKLKKSKKK